MHLKLYLVLLIVIGAPSLRAETRVSTESQDSSQVVYSLDEVIVYRSATVSVPSEVLHIAASRIERQAINSVAELIKNEPGLLVTSGRKNSSDLSIRCVNPQSVLMLIDGRPMNTGYFGGADLSLLPVNQIERMEIVKGPASVAYGANSLGGIVNIITKGGADTAPYAELDGLFGDLNHRELSASVGGSIGNYSGWITIEDATWDGVHLSDDYSPSGLENGGIRANSDLHRSALNLKLARNISNRGYLSVMAVHIQAEKGLPGSTQNAEYWRFTDWKRSGGNISYLYYLTHKLHLRSSIFANRYYDELVAYKTDDYSMDSIRYDSEMKSLTLGGALEIEYTGLNRHNIITGIRVSEDQAERRDISRNEPWAKTSDKLVSIYAEDGFQIQPDLLISAGAGSYHRIMPETDKSSSSFGYSVGIARKWSGNFTTRIGTSHSVFFPTQHNLYSVGRVNGNPDLEPEEAWKYEIGFDGRCEFQSVGMAGLQVAFFFQKTENQIDLIYISQDKQKFINIKKLDSWGMETTLEWQPAGWLDLSCSAAMIDWWTDGESLYNTPHTKISGRAFIRTPFKTEGNIETAWFGERLAPSSGGKTQDLPSYSMVNANISHPLNRWMRIRIVARNILDADYEEVYGYPAPGRQILGGIKVMIGEAG